MPRLACGLHHSLCDADELSELLEFGDPMGVLVKNAERVLGRLPALRKVIGVAGAAQSPAADLAAALAYLDQAREQRLPTALIQAQRDFFRSARFRVGRPGGDFPRAVETHRLARARLPPCRLGSGQQRTSTFLGL
ncbi:hypothetical protein [Trueperella pyogenes]|uniref:hypothetical protein n=1 Tax=Trueperella pyogenes TaxID=1661 RepID=UPI003DA7B48D